MEKIDYHDFHDEANDFIPLRITDEWIIENKEQLEELLFMFHQTYYNWSEVENHRALLKLYGEILNITFEKFNVGYL